jgi:hypothetical protein
MRMNQLKSGCETWFIALREKHRLSVSEKRMLEEHFKLRDRKKQEE